MISTLLLLTLSASDGWTEIKANGFVFEMPTNPELQNGPLTWPTTGKMVLTKWTSKLATGDQQLDMVDCYESTVPSPRMAGLLHEKFCTPESSEKVQWDRTDPTTQARQCLLVSQARRKLVKILQVGANLCVLSSSARLARPPTAATEPSHGQRRFVDSLKATGKPTVVSLTGWVVTKGNGFRFELPEKTEPTLAEGSDPKLGKFKSTKWKAKIGEEELNVLCLAGPAVSSPAAMQHLQVVCEMPGAKIVQTRLPNGASECANPGPPAVLIRFFPMGTQTCMVGATRDMGEISQAGRRFVESFVRAK